MKKHKTYWVKKYAFVLVCYYVIEEIASRGYNFWLDWMRTLEDVQMSDYIYTPLVYAVITYSLNVILAIILNSDIKKLQIKAKYAVLCTVVFAPMGVSLFLLYVILSEVNKSEQEFETPPSFY